MRDRDTNDDAPTLGLRALVWTLAEPDRAQRLLDVTGLDPDDLRARATEPAVLAAVLGFLEGHVKDMVKQIKKARRDAILKRDFKEVFTK